MRWTKGRTAVVAFWMLAGPAWAQPAPQPLTVLDVPFISQSEALCGGAAAAMVLRYWGERGLTAESFAHLVDRSAAGIRTDALVGELRDRGWNATGIRGTDRDIGNELARGRPVLALVQDRPGAFHYIVIVAATPLALVFHDPARAPMRVMGVEEFARRWQAAGQWMAVVVPGDRPAATAVVPAGDRPISPCDELLREGVTQAQTDDLAGAERSLTAALACPGSAAARELAGVRLLQRRWPDVEALAATAVAIDAQDAHAWRLLGTSRFVQDDAMGALAAWNRVAEPRVDLVRIDGLERTRQRAVERLLGVEVGEVLTPASLLRARRRLEDLPSASTTRLDYAPVPSGVAEVRAAVSERPLVPADAWSYAAIGALAAARREVEFAVSTPTGGGERIAAAWRFWNGRPGARLSVQTPAPWGGTWGVHGSWERQPFDAESLPAVERTTVSMTAGNWFTSVLHLDGRLGIDRWRSTGRRGFGGATLQLRSPADRLDGRVSFDAWTGSTRFASLDAALAVRSSSDRRGRVYVARGGAAAATRAAPPDIWFAGDTGIARAALLRAHPLVEDGRLRSSRLARRLLHGSAEAQHWWRLSPIRWGVALFADAARGDLRLAAGARADVDVGAGARLTVPGLAGAFRADVARGLRDGATTVSFVYEP